MKITDKENIILDKHIEYLQYAAKNNYGLKSHGFIYHVDCGFTAKLTDTVYIKDKEVLTSSFDEADYRAYKEKYIKKGSIIEFRYECNAHCRDIDNDYWEIDPSILALKCTPYAKINQDVKWNNKLNLKEILENKEYIKLERLK